MGSSGTNKLGLLAGAGQLPVLVATSAREQGREVHAFGFARMMSPELSRVTARVHEVPFAQVGALLARMKEERIEEAVTIGSIAQPTVLGGMPQFDDLALAIWRRLPDRRVDSIMRELVDELGRRGVKVVEAIDYLSDNMAPSGVLTRREPTDQERADIRFGFEMAKAIGGLDIGQTVVVKNRAVMAVEAVEGTDQAIARGGQLARGQAVVVKVAKPRQDMRYDVPAAGLDTLESMTKAGATLLAVESGKVLLVDRAAMIEAADRAGICLVGVSGDEVKPA